MECNINYQKDKQKFLINFLRGHCTHLLYFNQYFEHENKECWNIFLHPFKIDYDYYCTNNYAVNSILFYRILLKLEHNIRYIFIQTVDFKTRAGRIVNTRNLDHLTFPRQNICFVFIRHS
jgi:hypothetical protein